MPDEPKLTEVNCSTGEVIVRPLTEGEIAQAEADRAARIAQEEQEAAARVAQEAAALEKQALKESAISKLIALGLTDEEIAAILGA
jgi:FixJ family two-component response regulator